MRVEIGTQAAATTLVSGGGTCRDFTLVVMECARSLGLAARVATGHLYDTALDQAEGTVASPAFPQAWMVVYLFGCRVGGVQSANSIVGTERPIRGAFTGAKGVGVGSIVDVQVRTLEPGLRRWHRPTPVRSPSRRRLSRPSPPHLQSSLYLRSRSLPPRDTQAALANYTGRSRKTFDIVMR